MSSSPIRHEPPGSSPFKSSSQATRIDSSGGRSDTGTGEEVDMGMDGVEEISREELDREWGEYRGMNSVLYNLHRARIAHQNERRTTSALDHPQSRGPHIDNLTSHEPYYLNNTTAFQTPMRPSSQSQNHIQQDTPDTGSMFTTPYQARNQPERGDATRLMLPPSSARVHGSGISRDVHMNGTTPSHGIGRHDHQGDFTSPPPSHYHRPPIASPSTYTPFRPQSSQNQWHSRNNDHLTSSPITHPSSSTKYEPSSSPPGTHRYPHGDADENGDGDGDDMSTFQTPLASGQYKERQRQRQQRESDRERIEREEREEASRRYEEVNRMLGEFAVARRERWGGDDEDE